MRHYTTGILSEKCVVKQFCRCENVIECTFTNIDNIACYTPRLYVIDFWFSAKNVQHITLLNIVGNCNPMVRTYNII
jgi:hypothetical protein